MDEEKGVVSEGSPQQQNKIVWDSKLFRYGGGFVLLLTIVAVGIYILGFIADNQSSQEAGTNSDTISSNTSQFSVSEPSRSATNEQMTPCDDCETTRKEQLSWVHWRVALDIAMSPDRKRQYFVVLPHEGFSYLPLYYDETEIKADLLVRRTHKIPEVELGSWTNAESVEGEHFPLPYWLVSPDNRYLAFVTHTEDSITNCYPMLGVQPRIENSVRVLDLETLELLVLAEGPLNIEYTLKNWSADSRILTVVKSELQISENNPPYPTCAGGEAVSSEELIFDVGTL